MSGAVSGWTSSLYVEGTWKTPAPTSSRNRWRARRRPVTYLSVFEKVMFRRHAFVAPGQAMVCPLDAELSLPARCYSELLREWSGFGSANAAFREVAGLLERILGWPLSVQALETMAREDAVDVTAFYAREVDPAAGAEAATIVGSR